MDNINKEAVIRWLLDLVPHTRVTYHNPGELRLKLQFSGFGRIHMIEPDILTQVIPGILGVNIKWLSRSFIIEYDPQEIPYDILENLLNLKENPEQETKVIESLRKVVGSS